VATDLDRHIPTGVTIRIAIKVDKNDLGATVGESDLGRNSVEHKLIQSEHV
jgi:hypothetical protein